jgi:hypothetical protein
MAGANVANGAVISYYGMGTAAALGRVPGRSPTWRAEAALVLGTALLSLPLLATPGYEGDIARVKAWSRWATLEGVTTLYAMPDPYDVDYPPVTLYLYGLAGAAYRALSDPTFDLEDALESGGLTALLKGIGLFAHLMGAVFVSRVVLASAGAAAGIAAAAAYALNPAALYAVAHWGQPDPIHSFLLLASVRLLAAQRAGAAGLAFGLALMTKPQAWAFVPVFLGVGLSGGGSTLGRLAAGCAAGALLPAIPFLVAGTWRQLLDLPSRIVGWMPYVNAGAHNFWWLLTGGTNWDRLWAGETLWGVVTYRHAALGLVAAAAVFALWLTRTRELSAVAPYYAFAWYVFTVQAHENHSFFVLPLLAVTLHRGWWPRVAFAVVTATLLTNLFLHSPEIWGSDPAVFMHLQGVRLAVSLANAAVNVLLLACWTVVLVRGGVAEGLAASPASPRVGLVSAPAGGTA